MIVNNKENSATIYKNAPYRCEILLFRMIKENESWSFHRNDRLSFL